MFALKHKATGTFMPDKKGGAGGTYVEPFQKRRRQTTTPRLFARAADAKAALAWWAEGRVRMSYGGPPGEEERDFNGSDPVPGRNADDWAIVEVQLVEVSA